MSMAATAPPLCSSKDEMWEAVMKLKNALEYPGKGPARRQPQPVKLDASAAEEVKAMSMALLRKCNDIADAALE